MEYPLLPLLPGQLEIVVILIFGVTSMSQIKQFNHLLYFKPSNRKQKTSQIKLNY